MDIWVSAGETRNYALEDPLCDYFNERANRAGTPRVPGAFVQYILKSGQEFEHRVFTELGRRFPLESIKQVITKSEGISAASLKQRRQWHDITIHWLREGIPMIYQGFLLDDQKNIQGAPDLLVRSDYLKQIAGIAPLAPEEETKGCRWHSNFHYVVVEIKWTTLTFCEDRVHLRNEGSMKAFKCQVALYHHLLERVQEAGIHHAFILGKRTKTPSGEITEDCFHHLGKLNFFSRDHGVMTTAFAAVDWLQDLKREGHTWSLLPRPSRPELYPNMKNYTDDPWRKEKEQLAEQLREITNIWYCRAVNRRHAHGLGILSWDDPRCSIATLGIKGKVLGPIVQRILDVNRDPTTWILPLQLPRCNKEWLDYRPGDFYVDFEFIPMLDNSLRSFPLTKVSGLVYLIGTGYYDHNLQWHYRQFLVDRLTAEEEHRIFQEWLTFLGEVGRTHGTTRPRLFHWGNAEDTWFTRHTEKFPDNLQRSLNFQFVDVLKEIKRYPIVVKGAFGFSIKEYGQALYKLGKINFTWPALDQGLDTITHIMSMQDEAVRRGLPLRSCSGATELQAYNETDCRMVGEILDALRNYYEAAGEDEDDLPLVEVMRRRGIITVSESSGSVDSSIKEDSPQARKRTNDSPVPETRRLRRRVGIEEDEEDEEEDSGALTEFCEPFEAYDQIRVGRILDYMKNYSGSEARREELIDQLRALAESHGCTEDHFQRINILLYEIGQHPLFNPDLYSEELRTTVATLHDVEHSYHIRPEDIVQAPLPEEERVRLLQQYLSISTLVTFTPDWFAARAKLRQALRDAQSLTVQQQELLKVSTPNTNYLARIADSRFPPNGKAYLAARYREYIDDQKSENGLLAQRILEDALALPLGVRGPPLTATEHVLRLQRCKEYLDRHIYGMKQIKEQFLLESLHGQGRILGLCGSPGIGKSTFANAVGAALGRPVFRINMGGMTDVGMLIGSLPSWVGSQMGLLARALITCKQEDPVIVLDEIDKISTGHDGLVITQLLAHILDPNFNEEITDKFLGVSFSLRHVTFVVTLNDSEVLTPVIANRIRLFHLPDPTQDEKINICLQILWPHLQQQYELEVSLPQSVVEHLVRRTSEDKGLRTLQRLLASLCSKIRALQLLDPTVGPTMFSFYEMLPSPVILTIPLVERLLGSELNHQRPRHEGLYL